MHRSSFHRLSRSGMLLFGLLVAGVSSPVLGAERAETGETEDPRWLPWYGCWEPRGTSHLDGADLLLCILPDEDGVALTTWMDGELVETDRLQADAGPLAVTEAGCEGTRSLSWSADGNRLFLDGQVTCEPGGTRETRGVFTLTDGGYTWVEIQALGFGEGTDPILSVRTFHPASPASLERNKLEAPMADQALTLQRARQQAARPLTDEAIVEANTRAGSSVASALVAEMGHPFSLSTSRLRALRNRGVSKEVVDVMVAVTYPERFEIRADGRVGEMPSPVVASQAGPQGTVAGGSWGYSGHRYPVRYGFGYGLFWNPYLGYSYGAPGYGYGFSPYPWYSGPAYIVAPPRAPSGTMTPSGYRPSTSSAPARPANPATRARPTTPANNPPPPARSTPPATQSAPPPATSTPPRRQAIPRTGGGGDPIL